MIRHEWKRLDSNARHTSSTSITSDYLFNIVGTAKVSPRANDVGLTVLGTVSLKLECGL